MSAPTLPTLPTLFPGNPPREEITWGPFREIPQVSDTEVSEMASRAGVGAK